MLGFFQDVASEPEDFSERFTTNIWLLTVLMMYQDH